MISMFNIIETKNNRTITYSLTPGQELWIKHYISGEIMSVKIKKITKTNKQTTLSVWGTAYIPVKGNEDFDEIVSYDSWFPVKSLGKTLFLTEEECRRHYGR